MCWSKLKAKVNEDGFIKPAIFETEWNRWYILKLVKGDAELCENLLAEENASDEPREEYIRLLEKEIKTCKAIIREREFCGRIARFNPLPWLWSEIFGN